MEKMASYIKRIEIASMWNRKIRIEWTLRPDVNILSGVNGMGKSTILNKSIHQIEFFNGNSMDSSPADGVTLTFEPHDATRIRFDVIRSIDRPLLDGKLLEKMADPNVKTELDWQLYRLQRRYLDYQVNIGNRIIEALTGGPDGQQKAAALSEPKRKFQDYVDEFFADTQKRILRRRNEIYFEQHGEELHPYLLSSGEKQLLVILLTALVEDNEPCALFMDEPEISLHIDWQQRIINVIRDLNPNAQIILSTHSPAVIMNGWIDAVTDIGDLLQHG